MKRVIWKFILRPFDKEVVVPAGAQFLTVQMQGGFPVLWALVNPDQPKVRRKILLVGTGWTADNWPPGGFPYIGTFQLEEMGLVFHLFDTGAEEALEPVPHGAQDGSPA